MSDEDFMESCDSADYDFGYSDENNDADMTNGSEDPENKYYNAKALREDDPAQALEEFAEIISSDPISEIAIKAHKQSLKLLVKTNPDGIEKVFTSFLSTLCDTDINQSYRDQSFMNILDVLGNANVPNLSHLCRLTLEKLGAEKGWERLLARTSLKLATLYYANDELEESRKVLDSLDLPMTQNPSLESWKSALSLDVLALRIQIAMKQNTGEEQTLYESIQSGAQAQMAHPKVLAVIRECGGILAVRRKQWAEARDMLLNAFKIYDEAGMADRMRVLRYYILTSILTESALNPFDSQESKAYRNSEELSFLANLVDAFLDLNIKAFKGVLDTNREYFESDTLMQYLVPALRQCFQDQFFIKLVKPYTRIRFSFIAKRLQIPEHKVPGLAVQLIADGKLPKARIDDVNRIIEMTDHSCQPAVLLTSHIQLPSRYREYAESAKRDEFEKAILLAKENQAKETSDLSLVFGDLVKATEELHKKIVC